MAEAYASRIVDAPIEAVWDIVRDFGRLADWVPGLGPSTIEDGLAPDVVGCVRAFSLGQSTRVRERLTMLDDLRYAFSYNFETPAFPVSDYHAHLRLHPVTKSEATFAEWGARFNEAPEDAGTYERIISTDVFAAGLASLAGTAQGREAPEGAVRWQGARPAKVYCSSVIEAPIDTVWARMRDFSSMAEWHPDVSDMRILDGARPDQVGAVRRFRLGDGELDEQLTMLCDRTHAFRYRITTSPMPWLNYHAGVQLHAITDAKATFAIWTADWVASPTDDLRLIPMVHEQVFQRAFDTLAAQFGR